MDVETIPPHRDDAPPKSEAEQLAFFDETMARFTEARAKCGAVELHLDVAGTCIRLEFAGDRLVPHFMPALAHLVVEPSRDADVTFSLWDSSSTGVEMLPAPCAWECFTDRGDIWGMSSREVRSAFHWIECSLNLYHVERRQAVFWVQSDEALPFWTKASPLRTLFHWWMEQNGKHLLHAAAVGDENGALLITGKGGTGKSTSALACLDAGMQYIGDDYLIVQSEPEPRVFSLYCTAKLNADQVARFPELHHLVVNGSSLERDKAVIHLHPERASQISRSLPLRAIATPAFGSTADTSFAPLSRVQLQRAATFTTMTQLPHAGREMHEFMERLMLDLPALTMILGSDIARVPNAVRALLQLPAQEIERLGSAVADDGTGVDRALISVIIPVYNGASFLGDAIESVLRQQYSLLDIIVVDDGSTDDLDGAIARLPIEVRLFRQENAGAGSARNRGIRYAAGDLIAFLDVDDLWPDHNLALLARRLREDAALDAVHGRAQLLRHDPAAARHGEFIGNPGETFPGYLGAGLYRRRVFESVGLFDPDLRYGEDQDWFNRATERRARIEHLEEVTLLVRRHEANMTRGKTLVELNLLRVFKKVLDRRRAESARSA
ncbi:MAG: hypothetical protein JWM95_3375 [Gemmatimonadetes bacterium]|nr:hypothetical protein [Gemmatimonadota bacterium]